MSFKRRPPDWLVSFLPWLGTRRAIKQWREFLSDSLAVEVFFSISFAKTFENIVVYASTQDPSRLPILLTWAAVTVVSFIGGVFSWQIKRAAKNVADSVSDAAGADSDSED